MSESDTITAERGKNAEVLHLNLDIPGVGRRGDSIVHRPEHPNPLYRLCRIQALDVGILPEIKERVERERKRKMDLLRETLPADDEEGS